MSTLARVANFSMYHFHRMFTAMTGESLNRFIQRLRVEKAATLLVNSPKMSVTEIAYCLRVFRLRSFRALIQGVFWNERERLEGASRN